jgi:hypothetical protein
VLAHAEMHRSCIRLGLEPALVQARVCDGFLWARWSVVAKPAAVVLAQDLNGPYVDRYLAYMADISVS